MLTPPLPPCSGGLAYLEKIESVQYSATLAIAEAIKGSSRDKLYQELGLKYPQQRRSMRWLCFLYKFLSTRKPSHTHNLLPQMRNSHRHPSTFQIFPCRTEYFKNSFFPHVINEWNKLDQKFRRPIEKKIFNINDLFGIKMLTRLRLDFRVPS